MTQWWTYRPEDFLLFSERVYWRLFELQNEALWPAQIVVLALGAVCLAGLVRPRPWTSRFIALVLAAAWALTAWTFLWHLYAPVNWAISYVIPLFAMQALLLVWTGFRGAFDNPPARDAGTALALLLLIYALFIHPFTAVLAGRPIQSAEVFALAPDPTAIATLAILALARGGWLVRMLFAIPVIWCAMSAGTLYVMGAWQAAIPASSIVIAVLARLMRRSPPAAARA